MRRPGIPKTDKLSFDFLPRTSTSKIFFNSTWYNFRVLGHRPLTELILQSNCADQRVASLFIIMEHGYMRLSWMVTSVDNSGRTPS